MSDETKPEEKSYGQIAFEAFLEECPLAGSAAVWAALPAAERDAWQAAARAVCQHLTSDAEAVCDATIAEMDRLAAVKA